MEEHISVLKEEAINFLNVKDGGIYVDATLGFAGHAREVLKRNKRGFYSPLIKIFLRVIKLRQD